MLISKKCLCQGLAKLPGIAYVPVLAVILAANCPNPAFAQTPETSSGGPEISKGAESLGPVTPQVFEGDVRSLPRVPDVLPTEPIEVNPKRVYPRPGGEPADSTSTPAPAAAGAPDPLLNFREKTAVVPPAPGFGTFLHNFAGAGFNGVFPPDPVGDVGPNYYIQAINHPNGTIVTIYNKSDGSIAASFILATLGSGGCAGGLGDPIVLYDKLAGRWLLSEFSDTVNALCVYISQTGDPISGGWYAYQFNTPEFPDYPKYAVWPDAYYVTTNESSPALYALERTKMLAGLPASRIRRTVPSLAGFPFQALTPGSFDGSTPPPGNPPGYFIRHRDDEVHNPGSNNPLQDFLEIWTFKPNFTTPANSTLIGPFNIPIAEIDSDLCGLVSFSCFPQPNGIRLDPLREVVMWRLQYRNFGSYETLAGNLVTDVNGANHGGIRWFDLRKSGVANWALYQEGTYAPDSNDRWMGSIAKDGSGNIALGYSITSLTLFPGIRYAGRLATDPQGTLPQGEYILFNGTGSQGFTTRWGDYSSINVDPSDDCTFWYTNEYGAAGGVWATRIGAFRFDACLADLNHDGCVDRTDTDIMLAAIRSGSTDPRLDINHDGVVNRADFRTQVNLFSNPNGASCP